MWPELVPAPSQTKKCWNFWTPKKCIKKNHQNHPFWAFLGHVYLHNFALHADMAMKFGRILNQAVAHLPRKGSKKYFVLGTQKWPKLKKKVVPLVRSRMRPRVAYYLVPKIIEEEMLFLLFSLALWPSLWAFGISLGILGDDRRSNTRLFSLCVIWGCEIEAHRSVDR